MNNKNARECKKMTKRKNGVIRAKSNFFRTARYGLTLQEHRIIYYAILKGQQDKTPFEPVTISVIEFQNLFELKGHANYSILRNLSKKMVSKSVEITYKDENGYHLSQVPWLLGITYHAKEGAVTIELNKKLQPFFEGKPFTETEFYFLIKFTSQYAERLYELIKSLSHKSIIDFSIVDLRNNLAVSNGKYANFNDLKRYVLDPAIQDINKFTDLTISMRESRGRYNKVEIIYFSVRKKAVPKLAKRVEQGEFNLSLSEQEQEIFIKKLLHQLHQDEEKI